MKKVKINISEEPQCDDLKSIGSIFVPITLNAQSSENFIEIDIILNWEEIVGKEIYKYTNPLKVKYNPKEEKRTLTIEVPVGGFALELTHKEKYLLDKINAYLGYEAIHQLKISQNINMQVKSKMMKENEYKEPKLSKEEEEYIKNTVGEIEDEKLKEILLKLGKSIMLSKKGV